MVEVVYMGSITDESFYITSILARKAHGTGRIITERDRSCILLEFFIVRIPVAIAKDFHCLVFMELLA